MLMRKPFEQELHDKFDEPAKRRVANYLERKCGVLVYPNPDKYGIDLLVCNAEDEFLGSVEVEVRQWSSPCPFPTIHVPHRKEKFFDDKTLFFALTSSMCHAYWIEGHKIKQYPIKEISNYKVPRGEMFFDIPVEAFVHVNLMEKE